MPQGSRSRQHQTGKAGVIIRIKGPGLCISAFVMVPQALAAWRTFKHLEGVPRADVQTGGVEWGGWLSGRAATGLKVKQRGGLDKRASITRLAQWRPGPETTLLFDSDEAAACRQCQQAKCASRQSSHARAGPSAWTSSKIDRRRFPPIGVPVAPSGIGPAKNGLSDSNRGTHS